VGPTYNTYRHARTTSTRKSTLPWGGGGAWRCAGDIHAALAPDPKQWHRQQRRGRPQTCFTKVRKAQAYGTTCRRPADTRAPHRQAHLHLRIIHKIHTKAQRYQLCCRRHQTVAVPATHATAVHTILDHVFGCGSLLGHRRPRVLACGLGLPGPLEPERAHTFPCAHTDHAHMHPCRRGRQVSTLKGRLLQFVGPTHDAFSSIKSN
jgi:hypothetical protein